MRNAKRGRGSRHGVYFGAAAAVGLALSGCGGGGSSSAASAVSTSAQSTAAATAPATAPAQSTPTDGGTTTSSTSGNKPGSTSGSKSGGTTTGSDSTTGGTTPVAHANTVTINWTPPTENTNGSPLTNLAGYNIHYGTSSGHLSKKIAVANPGIATYVVSNLSAGRYYFAVAAVNSAGTESPLSSQVSATVTN